MTKYFSLPTIKSAVENLKPIDSKWLIIPLVLAANGVTQTVKVECNKAKGTGKYLSLFFDGKLMGLEPREHGAKCNVRPGNPDPRRINEKLITVDYSDLWGKTYSQSGYGDWQDGLILMRKAAGDKGAFQLGPNFAAEFKSRIGDSFKFEDLLVWLYAFRGVPDSISSWNALLDDFETNYTVSGIPNEYKGVFSLSGSQPWPSDILPVRPTDEEIQSSLVPELVTTKIAPQSLISLRDGLQGLIRGNYLEISEDEVKTIANSVVAALQSCRRLFLYGDPGTGKTELARIIGTAFEAEFGKDRVHVVFVPIADSTSVDKLIGFSTLDGTWVHGMLTQPTYNPTKELLYEEGSSGAMQGRRQLNVLILDEANRRDIEELLVMFQAALDSESAEPSHDDFRVRLDNAGERRISPNTFVIMTGNSPREDSGRVVQSRPFKRRHNFLAVENVFTRVLIKSPTDFIETLGALWQQVGLALRIEAEQREAFLIALKAPEHIDLLTSTQGVLQTLNKHSIGVSFGLVKKVLKTAAMHFALTNQFKTSMDLGLTEAVFPLLSAEEPLDGKSIKDDLETLPTAFKRAYPTFFGAVDRLLRAPDALGRVRPFL